ncbi:uncharacterized protein V6R79_022316 [Siganus canaliculatus]
MSSNIEPSNRHETGGLCPDWQPNRVLPPPPPSDPQPEPPSPNRDDSGLRWTTAVPRDQDGPTKPGQLRPQVDHCGPQRPGRSHQTGTTQASGGPLRSPETRTVPPNLDTLTSKERLYHSGSHDLTSAGPGLRSKDYSFTTVGLQLPHHCYRLFCLPPPPEALGLTLLCSLEPSAPPPPGGPRLIRFSWTPPPGGPRLIRLSWTPPPGGPVLMDSCLWWSSSHGLWWSSSHGLWWSSSHGFPSFVLTIPLPLPKRAILLYWSNMAADRNQTGVYLQVTCSVETCLNLCTFWTPLAVCAEPFPED